MDKAALVSEVRQTVSGNSSITQRNTTIIICQTVVVYHKLVFQNVLDKITGPKKKVSSVTDSKWINYLEI